MKKNTSVILYFTTLLLGILAAFMILTPSMAFANAERSFSGYEIVFGTEFANLGGIATGQVVGNILGLLAYLLPLIACLLAFFVKKSGLIAALLFIAGAVLLFLLPEYIKTTVTILGTTNEIDVNWVFAYGVIFAAVCSIVGASICLYTVVSHTQKD